MLITMDFLDDHYKKAVIKHDNNPELLAAINHSWHAFDKWYSATDQTPVYAAAVLLHPQHRLLYLKH